MSQCEITLCNCVTVSLRHSVLENKKKCESAIVRKCESGRASGFQFLSPQKPFSQKQVCKRKKMKKKTRKNLVSIEIIAIFAEQNCTIEVKTQTTVDQINVV